MIKYVIGDLLVMAENGDFDVIAQCANCFNTMGSGIAPLIKARFPEAYAVDNATIKGDASKLGTITHTVNTTPIVVNIYGQYDYTGRRRHEMDLDYNALRSGLRLMKQTFSGKRFGMPKLGAGLAGGDWTIIERIIQEEFAGEYVTIVLLSEE